MRLILAMTLVATLAATSYAQDGDSRGEVTVSQPSYKGVTAAAPIPPKYHIRNEGGSDGAGLCVISSVVCNGSYQGIPGIPGGKDDSGKEIGKQSKLWRTAKSRPGGYDPGKLSRLIDEVMPSEKYANYTGTNPDILDRLSSLGYPIGATMNTGALYNYRPIHHMISLIHYRKDGYACVVDNNDPGKYHWMPSTEFNRRWIDGGTGWAFIWTRLPVTQQVITDAFPAIIAVVGLGFLILGISLQSGRKAETA